MFCRLLGATIGRNVIITPDTILGEFLSVGALFQMFHFLRAVPQI
jgi:hypothetical protein